LNIISIEHFHKSYGEKVLFDDLNFGIDERQRIGLVGVNGTGKSSLLKAIAGLEPVDSGKLSHSKHFRAEYLPQNPEFDKDSTVLEQVFYGDTPLMQTLRDYELALTALQTAPEDEKLLDRLFSVQHRMDTLNAWEASTTAEIVLTRLGITNFSQKVGLLSGGQRKRVAMARVLIQPAELLILDEPTNHIDHMTVEWLEEFLSKWKGALLIVTHDRYFLDRVTNRIIELDKGKLYSYEGNYADFLEKKAERLEREASEEDKRQNLLRHELAWLRRGPKARSTKQKARIDRTVELRDRKVDGPTAQMDVALGASRLGKKVMELENVGKSFEGRKLINDFSYIVMPDDRLGIIGPNGSGKSTLLNMLAGRLQPDEGTVGVGSTVKLAYYTQESVEMDEKLRVIEYIKEGAEIIKTASGETITASQMLERFLFSGALQWTPISKLSGGERRRLYLLRTLMGEPNVLLLDEPTNDLDIQTLTILEEYLEDFPGAVITVSHDRYFLDRTADHLFVFENGSINRFIGNYSDYLASVKQEELTQANERKQQAQKPVPEPKAAAPVPSDSKDGVSARKLTFNEQKEWEQIEQRMASLEERLTQIKQEIERSGSDYGKIEQLYAEEQKVSSQLEQAMDRWAVLSELIEQISSSK
jgi:ATP-binding cassette subfamily F protein uup